MLGKEKCRYLRQLRQRIAEENEITLLTKDCTYQGSCSGTCPKCEAELRELEQQLAARQRLGKTVTVAALAASLVLSASGCVPISQEHDGTTETVFSETATLPTYKTVVMGEVPNETDTSDTQPAATEETTEEDALTGDIAYFETSTPTDGN